MSFGRRQTVNFLSSGWKAVFMSDGQCIRKFSPVGDVEKLPAILRNFLRLPNTVKSSCKQCLHPHLKRLWNWSRTTTVKKPYYDESHNCGSIARTRLVNDLDKERVTWNYKFATESNYFSKEKSRWQPSFTFCYYSFQLSDIRLFCLKDVVILKCTLYEILSFLYKFTKKKFILFLNDNDTLFKKSYEP